jgi:hypothetical protein
MKQQVLVVPLLLEQMIPILLALVHGKVHAIVIDKSCCNK